MKKLLMLIVGLLLVCSLNVFAENIDPHDTDNQYAWAQNVGWLNFEPNVADPNVGLQVSSDKLNGFIWAENIGWISLSPTNYGGVLNDGNGNLSGYAWGENVGWINFDTSALGGSQVTVSVAGQFDGKRRTSVKEYFFDRQQAKRSTGRDQSKVVDIGNDVPAAG